MVSSLVLSLASLSASASAVSPHLTEQNWAKNATSASSAYKAAATPETTVPAEAPWQFRVFSENFVPAAVSFRSANVSEEEASSVAKKLVDDGLAHPQYTKLLSQGFEIYVSDGFYPDATSVYDFATNAQSAYEEIHTDLSYWSYVNYARSAVSLFDFEKLDQYQSKVNEDPRNTRAIAEQSSYVHKIYSSLAADPTGSAALETLKKVSDEYSRDFSINHSPAQVSVIEKILMKALGTF